MNIVGDDHIVEHQVENLLMIGNEDEMRAQVKGSLMILMNLLLPLDIVVCSRYCW